jgi:uncharacterized membrane protein
MAEDTKSPEEDITLSKTNKAALAVLLAPTIIGTLVMLFLNKDEYIRFYGLQILLLGGIIAVLQWALVVTVVLSDVSGLLFIFGFGAWLLMVYKAWLGEYFSVPVIGDLAKRLMKKGV